MNSRGQQGYQQYRGRERWEDDASSSSAYEARHMSPYREPGNNHHSNNGYSSDPGSVGSTEDGPTYVLEHLATFRVSPEAGLVYPSDGMRRLLHMEKTTGIWTQKMLLKLDRKWVLILSHENGDVVEKFPMELIREPTAFTSEDSKELYNNIFIFVVAEDPKRKYDNPTEMHIFQCLRISAKDVVEDVKLYMSGKTLSVGAAIRGNRSVEHIPPPPQDPAPEPPLISNGYRDFSDSEVRVEMRGTRSERSSVSHNDEVSSTSSERYERDVAILNNCFDDIERFIARLQHTAAATRELERRRRSRKSKKKDIGDGLLSMRAKPPPEKEFIDIFQKFKLSFNLLAKLRAHIRDPNAPELVHFLFTPLALIVDASRDSYFESSLPPKVISPLLTQEAIELLTNCLSSRETELWQSLGNAWLIPKESWKYPVQPYRPVFYSGWAPEVSDDIRDKRYPLIADRTEGELRRNIREEFDYYDSDRKESSPLPSEISQHHRYRNPPAPHHAREDSRPRSITPLSEYQPEGLLEGQVFEKVQRRFLEELHARDAKVVQVTYPRTANNEKELTVSRGEYLEVVDDSKKWWKAMNCSGVVAHVPHTIVTPLSMEDIQDIRRGNPGVRSPKKGEVVPIIPAPPPLPKSNMADSQAIIPGPVTPSNSLQNMNEFKSKSQNDLMNEELKSVLEELNKTRRNLEIVKTPDVYIYQNSSPQDVQQWLQMKGFDQKIQNHFKGVNGGKLFAMTKRQLEALCGKVEGSRLDSQITVQRNISGYKTARSSELKQVLAQRRKKVESASSVTKVMESSSASTKTAETGSSASKLVENDSSRSETVGIDGVKMMSDRKGTFFLSEPEDDGGKDVINNFKFLQQYEADDIKDAYMKENKEMEPTDCPKVTGSDIASSGTLKEQIQKQRQKIATKSLTEVY